jgi:hypothetical protein
MPSKTRRTKPRQTKAKKTKVAKQKGGQEFTVADLKAALNGVNDNVKVVCVSYPSSYDAESAGYNQEDNEFEIAFSG